MIQTRLRICILITTLLFCFSEMVAAKRLSSADLVKELDNFQSEWSSSRFDENHPSFLTESSIKAFKLYSSGQVKKAEEILNKLFSKNRFEIPVEELFKTNQQVTLETVGSTVLWRDLAYLVMARINYDNKRYKAAEKFYRAISGLSPLKQMADSEKLWTFIHLQWDERLEAGIEKAKLSAEEKILFNAYLSLRKDNYKSAIPNLERLSKFEDRKIREIATIYKLHAYFLRFITEKTKQSFNANVVRVNQIINLVKSEKMTRKDSRVAYLMGETYWHLASLYRIEDPDRFEGLSQGSLIKADYWLGYWFDQSLRFKKALLPEEALFLSAIILWEADRPLQAIERLKQIPQIFPSGEYIEDAYQLLGDYYFEKRKFAEALHYFRKLARVGSEEKTAYGTYKAAWCFYNLKEKFKALRHFQRLTRYYLDFKKRNKEYLPGNLRKEAYKDMMTLLGELTTFAEAKKELEHLDITKGRKIEVLEELSGIYEAMGRFQQSVNAYSWLLSEYSTNERAWIWLGKLSKAYLSGGMRPSIPVALNKYITTVKKVKSDENRKNFIDQFERLQLTLQKEARKSADDQIFSVVDELYVFWKEHFFSEPRGRLVYFGAQRYERREMPWSASEWYIKASEDRTFKNYKDSALSVMSIVVKESDKLSLNSKATAKQWNPVFENAKWVYESKLLDNQKLAVAKHLFEAAHYINKLNYIEEEILSLVKSRGFQEKIAFLYFQENKRRYQVKDFKSSHRLSDRLMKEIEKSEKSYKLSKESQTEFIKFKESLLELTQESAFQVAFNLSQKKDEASVEESRTWYKKAVLVSPQSDIAFRAWYNEIVGYKKDVEDTLFLERLKNFRASRDLTKSKLSFEQIQLTETLIRREVGYYEAKRLWQGQYQALGQLLPFLKDNERKKAIFQRLILSSLLYKREDFRQLVIQYAQVSDKMTIEEMEFVARSFEWFDEQEEAHNWVEKILTSHMKFDSSVALLVRDQIIWGKQSNSRFKRTDKAIFYKKQFKYLKDQALLLTSWHHVLDILAFKTLKSIDESFSKRAIASVPSSKSLLELKRRVSEVGSLLQKLSKQRGVLYKLSRHWSPRIKQEAICKAGPLTEYFTKALGSLREPEVKHPQFKDFVSQLNQKVAELEKERNVEIATCSQQQAANIYLKPIDRGESSIFCQVLSCDNKPLSKGFVAPRSIGMGQFYEFLSNKQTRPLADDLSRVSEDQSKQSIQFIVLRLFKGDLWNARQLFLSLEKQLKHQKSSFYLVGALISKAANDKISLENYLGKVNGSELSPHEKSIYQRLSAEPKAVSSL